MDVVFNILIDLMILGVLLYTYYANRTFFIVGLLIILLLVFIFPSILIPSFLWEKLLAS